MVYVRLSHEGVDWEWSSHAMQDSALGFSIYDAVSK